MSGFRIGSVDRLGSVGRSNASKNSSGRTEAQKLSVELQGVIDIFTSGIVQDGECGNPWPLCKALSELHPDARAAKTDASLNKLFEEFKTNFPDLKLGEKKQGFEKHVYENLDKIHGLYIKILNNDNPKAKPAQAFGNNDVAGMGPVAPLVKPVISVSAKLSIDAKQLIQSLYSSVTKGWQVESNSPFSLLNASNIKSAIESGCPIDREIMYKMEAAVIKSKFPESIYSDDFRGAVGYLFEHVVKTYPEYMEILKTSKGQLAPFDSLFESAFNSLNPLQKNGIEDHFKKAS